MTKKLFVFVVLVLVGIHAFTPTGQTSPDPIPFAPAVSYAAGGAPASVFCADLDGDTDLDLAAAILGSDSLSILINNGDGTFYLDSSYLVGDAPRSAFCADLDRDNDLDLAVANLHTDNVSILKNNGDGTFQNSVNYAVGDYPNSVFCADLDGDSSLDLALANQYSNNVSILINNGDGTFQHTVNYGAGAGAHSAFCADLDGDTDLDLAVANLWSNNVSILKNNGDGTFQSAVNYGAGYRPFSVFCSDLDGDTDLDLAVANVEGDNLSILKNNGDGEFTAPDNYGVGDHPSSVFCADLDGDSDLDLAVPNAYSDNVSILKNNGDGTFELQDNYGAGDGAYSVFCADLDGDSDLDLAVGSDSVYILINLSRDKALAVVEEGQKAYLDTVLPAIGLEPVYSTSFPSDMSEYCLVICSLYPACNPQSASYIENYVNSGGGAIVTDGTPYYLAGGSTDLSSISNWFGAGYYHNDGDTVSVIVDQPFGTALLAGDTLARTSGCADAAVSSLQPGANAIAQWHGGCDNNIAAFYYTYGSGKVYYSYSLRHPHVNHTVLLRAAMSWANSCVAGVEICKAFLTSKRINVRGGQPARPAPGDKGGHWKHDFKIHIIPCEPMNVTVGDSADVFVDVDASGTFDEDENYLATVSSTDLDSEATDIAIKVYIGEDLIDNDPCVAIYSINNISIVDTLGNQIDYLCLDTFEPPGGDRLTMSGIPERIRLGQSYPNPFNPTCEIAYALPSDCCVTLSIYNLLGQKVRVLVDEYQSAGHKSVKWDGKDDQDQDVTSGIYFYRIEAGDFEDTKTMTLVK